MNASEADAIRIFAPNVLLALRAAELLLTRRSRLRSAEKRHFEQGASSHSEYRRAVAQEDESARALREMLHRVGVLPDVENCGGEKRGISRNEFRDCFGLSSMDLFEEVDPSPLRAGTI